MAATIITVFNNKGGVGKTTVVLNLSCVFAKHYCKVLVIDSDSQSSVSKVLGPYDESKDFGRLQEMGQSLGAVYQHNLSIASAIAPVTTNIMPKNPVTDGLPYFGLVYGLLDLQQAEQFLLQQTFAPGVLRKRLGKDSRVLDYYNLIIIDLPPSLGILLANALYASDYAITPVVTHDQYGFDQLTNTLNALNEVRNIPEARVKMLGLLRNMHDGRRLVNQAINTQLEQLAKAWDIDIFETNIPANTAISAAVTPKLPVTMFAPSSKGAAKFHALAKEIAGIIKIKKKN